MSFLKMLGAEGLFGDVQRMDKRQVSRLILFCNCLAISSHEQATNLFFFLDLQFFFNVNPFTYLLLLVLLPSFELWNDCLISFNDMERSDGGNWQRISHCCSFERVNGASFPSGRLTVPHQLPRRTSTCRRNRCVQS